jgi:phytol kinase
MLNWVKIALIVLAAVSLMVLLAIYQRRSSPHPEWVRKLMHLGAGLTALALPWLFEETWPVVVLMLLTAGGMAAIKYSAGLRESVGTVTGGVLRTTLGEICFPLGAGIVFLLAEGDKLLYSVPLLILTFADASAALIGVFYGSLRYTTSEGTKTLEGSLAFFQAAFLSTLVPILLFSDVGRAETLLIALLMGLLSMLLDATAWWGLDNLFIPILSFLLLQAFVHLDAPTLTVQLVVTVAIMALVLFWRKRTTLNDSAVLGTVIYGYLCWTLGGWQWLIPPLILFLSYNLLSPTDVKQDERPYTVQVVLGIGATGIFWLALAELSGDSDFYYPFMLSFAAQLAMIGSSRYARYLGLAGQTPALALLARNVVIGWLMLFIPYVLVVGIGPATWVAGIGGLIGVAAGAAIFTATQWGPGGYRNRTSRWLMQALSAGLSSIVGLIFIQVMVP